MKAIFGLLGIMSAVVATSALVATDASAQDVNLSGRWRCFAQCAGAPPNYAFITQNGWDLNMVNDAGVASRAWLDYPGRIWIDQINQGAVYTPDGAVLQFDGGTIWQRVAEVPLPRRRR
jgi:hypothetical protein